MGIGRMVAVPLVVGDELPVSGNAVALGAAHLHLSIAVAVQPFVDDLPGAGKVILQGRLFRIEAGEYETAVRTDPRHLQQVELPAFPVRAVGIVQGHGHGAARRIVSPGVIGADKHPGISLVLAADLGAAVRAAVEQHVYITLNITSNDHRAPAKPACDKIPRYGNLTLMAHKHPGTGKNVAHLTPEQRLTGINRPVDAVFPDEIVPVSGQISGIH